MWSWILAITVLVTLMLDASSPAGPARESQTPGRADSEPREGPLSVRGSWSWPVLPPHAVARRYLAPPTPYAAGHRGVDVRTIADAQLLAPDDGVVHFSGVVADRPVLSIDHGGGVLSSFEPVATSLLDGDAVTRGQVIGTVLPGHCVTPCVHLGARVHGQYVNPLLFLGGVPWSVLWPSVPSAASVSSARSVPAAPPGWELTSSDVGEQRSRASRRESSCARVRAGVALLEALSGHMCVDLRGRKTRVAEDLLYGAQVCSPIQKVRGSRVPEGMRAARARTG